ncbi:antitoxin Xre/MbcA/ParS toxin-binding domain-containing protein [Sphingomonas sp. CARO-RG-8B-R24-01]|uniref:antitoxin Xre/MbcA/ParS-like domain-containing protein n=1 Tax=Sphingomonas sp. CARO-RG-8B-R24-01 TaxID=2914831 RepID=UPI001F5A3320|nr:antitoxin Xre/MbcA/ParS toxin-binding domain-containing protein [Sphingomonas sp. CARO-RG-8B-R24-01]
MSSAALLTNDEIRLHSLSEGEVRAALQQHNPGAPAGNVRTMAKIIAVVSDVLAELPDAKRRKLVNAKGELREALIQATRGARRSSTRRYVEEAGKVETSQGSGLGERVSLEEGRVRLDRYATAKPLDSWAGPVAGAGEIEEQLGIPRSTLSNWQQRGVVIGLLRGERKLAYPLEQFVDARPLEGISDVLKVAPDARSAWLWLRQQHGALNEHTPLEILRTKGGRQRVAQVADRDFV